MIDLEHVMERIAQITSGDTAIRLTIRGDRAYSEPGAITLPSIERYGTVFGGEHVDAERLMHGLADHEIGHAADSDHDLLAKAEKELGRAYKVLVNALEDGYVEGRRGILYPGSRYNLRKKNEWFWSASFVFGQRSVRERLADPEMNTWWRFILALAMVVRPYGGVSLEQIEHAAPDIGELLRLVEDLLDELPATYAKPRQSHVVEALARRVWDRLMEHAEEPPEGEGGEGDEERDGGGEESDEMPAGYLDLERFERERDTSPLNPEEAIAVTVRKVFEQPENLRPYVVFDQTFDLERDFSRELTDALSQRYAQLQEEAAAATDELVYAFETALQDREMGRMSFDGDEEGDIDPALLPAFSMGVLPPEDLWIDYRAEQVGGRAAVAILIDCSGSMGNGIGRKLDPKTGEIVPDPSASHVARLCAIASHEALKRCQVPHEINGFTTIDSGHVRHGHYPWAENLREPFTKHFRDLGKACRAARARGTDLTQFARTWRGSDRDLSLPIYGTFKGFGHEDGRGLVLVAGLANNLDGEAVLWQARRLAQRPEERKVMVVLSDGYPAGSHDNAQGARYLSEAVERALGAGIELYGIGIKSDAVQAFYPHWWVCNDLADLPEVMMRALTETIVKVGEV